MKQALASNVRRLRVARHLSLSELARATAISKATLSGIERGNANPTVETLAALAGALHVGVGELLEEPELAPIHIVRADRAATAAAGVVGSRTLDTLRPSGELDLVALHVPAHRVEDLPPREPGSRCHVFVLQGKPIAGPVERVSELATGDYASFPADVPHQIEAGARPARVLMLVGGRAAHPS